jgi:ankyrin repeat protein
MTGQRTPGETLERLRKEAKRRLKAIKAGEEQAVRWLRNAIPNAPEAPTLRHVQHAIARGLDFPGWAALKAAFEAPMPKPESPRGIVNRFLDNACPDHHVRGMQDHRRAEATAMRLLAQHPWIATHDFNTAVVCGEIDHVREAIARDPKIAQVASETPTPYRAMSGGENDLYANLGAKGWPPLLYACFTRLPLAKANDNAVEIAKLLLDAGADPNAFFHAGDSHYTPMTGAVGRGEEDRPPHPRRNELVQLLLDSNAEPYDIQVVYNLGFDTDYLWWLPMIHERSHRIGRAADWKNPNWDMLGMGGYGCGARWFLGHAIEHHNVALAAWCLEHGASPNPPPAKSWANSAGRSLYEDAVLAGETEIAALLVRHGASEEVVTMPSRTAFHSLCNAAEKNRPEVIRQLVASGVSPDIADDKNTRALHHAAWNNSLDAARALIELGAEIDPTEHNHGGTPFGGAAHFLNRAVMDLLAPLTRDVWNLTYDGRVDRLREVLAETPERARVDWGEWTPLRWLPPHDEDAALEIAKLFVSHGADPSLRHQGISAADRAEALGMTRVAEYLRSVGG